jgi:quercetin dioxygenase-like cupin family protein
MNKINLADVPESFSVSPKGRFGRGLKDISVALGRKPKSLNLSERFPFDVQICRIPPGKARGPYHYHTSQFEYYQVVAGGGNVRHEQGVNRVVQGDAFQFGPGEPHQLVNDSADDFIVLVVADNPISEACYYPDSDKWLIDAPAGVILKSQPIDYFAGEE